MKKLSSNQNGMSLVRAVIVTILLIILFTIIFFLVIDTSEFRQKFEPESTENQVEIHPVDETQEEKVEKEPKDIKNVVNGDGSINY